VYCRFKQKAFLLTLAALFMLIANLLLSPDSWIVFELWKNCDGEDEDCKTELIWQAADDGGRDDCSFAET